MIKSSTALRRRESLKAFILDYLTSKDASRAFVVLALVLAGNLAGVRLALLLNEWYGRFFDALAAVDETLIIREICVFAALAAAIIIVLVSTDYLKSRLILTARRTLTLRLLEKWLSDDGAHYRLRESGREPDNPDQRILEDAHAFVSLSLNLFLSFFESILTIGTFSAILWSLSAPLDLGWVELPGYMFWACIIYTALGTLFAHLIGRPLKALNIEAQRREADLRYALIEKRRHADAIAGSNGEPNERRLLAVHIDELIDLLVKRLKKLRDLSFFTVGMGQITHMTPMILGLPGLFSGTYAIGGLMQLKNAFVDVSRSLSWFIVAYDDLAKLAAVAARLDELLKALENSNKESKQSKPSRILEADFKLKLPDHKREACIRICAGAGQTVLVTGPSGTGKSTALKAIAGFYQNFEGRIEKPERCLWLPQSPYLLKGTLRSNLCYPNTVESIDDDRLKDLLEAMDLAHLTPRLDEAADWRRQLSGGEAQRAMLIRALIASPDLLLLDEATSALDEDAACALVALMRARLDRAVIVMASHQNLSNQADVSVRIESTPIEASAAAR